MERDSQKGIIIGKDGALLKKIGTEARREIEALIDLKVNLKLWVKVRKKWRRDQQFLNDMGYKIKKMLGVAVTVIASTLPSFIVILLIASLFSNIQDNVYVIKAFKAIRPMVVALIAASVYTIGKSAKINRKTLWIVLLVAAMVAFLKFPPIAMIVLGAVLGNVWMIWRKNK